MGASQSFAERQSFRFVPWCKDAEMSDFSETIRKYVVKETAHEFGCGDSHDFLLFVIAVVSPTERNIAVIHADDSVV